MWQSCRSNRAFSWPDSVPGNYRIRRLLFGKKRHSRRRKEQIAASNEVSYVLSLSHGLICLQPSLLRA